MAFAIIETGGKQYKVTPGQKVKVETLGKAAGETVGFQHVLLAEHDGKVAIGSPYLKNAKIEAKVIREGRGEKKIVFRYHSKTRYRKKKTHRQDFTEVEITKIE